MKKYRLAVCKGPECRAGGSDQIFSLCRQLIMQAGNSVGCEIYRGGCYGLCDRGPNAVIREDRGLPKDPLGPENFQLMGWEGEHLYNHLTEQKIHRIVEEHIGKDRVAKDLLRVPEEAVPAAK